MSITDMWPAFIDRDGDPATYVRNPDNPAPEDFEIEKKNRDRDLRKMEWAFREIAKDHPSSPKSRWFDKIIVR